MFVLTAFDPERVDAARRAGDFLWLDLVAPGPEALAAAGEGLGLHPLAVEDSREFGQRPKLDRYDGTALAVVYGADADRGAPYEVHLHITPTAVVTVRPRPLPALDALHDHAASDPPRPEDAVVYLILDALVDTLGPAVERYGEQFAALETDILQQPERSQLERVYRLKRAITELERRVEIERDLFGELSATVLALPGLDPKARPYLRDVGDHLAKAAGQLARQSGALGSLTDLYFNANSERIAVISERLTFVATVLLPITVVTGFFGQNFAWLVDHIQSFTAFLVLGVGGTLLPILVALAYVVVRRRRR